MSSTYTKRHTQALHGLQEDIRAKQDFFMYVYKTALCTGQHAYSEHVKDCIHAHDPVELRRDPRKHAYRLARCLYYDSEEGCRRGLDCPYVHSNNEVLFHPTKYKTHICPRWIESSTCPKGDLCAWAHSEEELRRPPPFDLGPPPIPESQRAPHIDGPRGKNRPPLRRAASPRGASCSLDGDNDGAREVQPALRRAPGRNDALAPTGMPRGDAGANKAPMACCPPCAPSGPARGAEGGGLPCGEGIAGAMAGGAAPQMMLSSPQWPASPAR